MGESAERDAPPPLAEAVCGALGIAESVLLSAAFVATYTSSGQQTQPALIAAVALGALFGIARVVRKQTAQFAPAGLVGIAVSAYVVSRTGRAEDFFLPGLLANAGYALAYAISIALRWPLLGVFIAIASNRGLKWRQDPARVRAYSRASWVWGRAVLAPARSPAAAVPDGRRRRARRPRGWRWACRCSSSGPG